VVPATAISTDVIEGKWSTEITLTVTGTNTIIATATDAAGNTGKSSAAIIYIGALEVLVDRVGKIESDIAALDNTVTGALSDTESSITSELSSTTTDLKSEMASLESSVEGEMEKVKTEISNLSTLIIVAVILSLVAAIFAIFSVVTITRKIVLK